MENTLKFIKHRLPCPSCDSSDAVSMNENGSAKCFSCGKFFHDYDSGDTGMTYTPNKIIQQANDSQFSALSDRRISLETAKKFGVKVVFDSQGRIAQHKYPYYNNNELSGYKIRYTENKNFSCEGDIKNTSLFGQNLFKGGGKYLTIVEGECDAMAGYELLGSKWAVVSVRTGAQGAVKDVKENIEYIESFDNVVICFDNDKQGREAAKKVASILKPRKARIMQLPTGFKDANDMLKQTKYEDFVSSWWGAKIYTPSGIIRVSEKQKDFLDREHTDSVPFEWEGLNKKIVGLRQKELLTLTGGTGLGKSSVTRELEHWLINNTKDNVGIIALEEDWRRTVDGILSIEANQRLYMDEVRNEMSEDKLNNMFQKVFSTDRVFIHSHFGTNDIDDIFSKLRYLIVGCDCRWVVIDHLHMLVSSMTEGDERRAIDNIMTRIRSIVEETGAGIILVSHLRKIQGDKGHENGVSVSLSHLRGSNSIAQLSDTVIALERNQQAEDDLESRTTKLRVLKCRYTGDVGMATALTYDKETGRLSEVNHDELFNFNEEEIPF